MPGTQLTDFLSTQFSEYHHTPFENECNTQFLLHSEPDVKKKFVKWLKEFKVDTSNKSVDLSDHYREEGNRLFRANKSQNALEAARCYTNAILAAPDGTRALALAHANRSAAIAEFGFYEQAYEDCQCAIDFGYPDENIQKIRTRQAVCASKLEDPDKLSACLDKLRCMTLSTPFAKQKEELEEQLIRLQDDADEEKPEFKDHYIVHKISKHPHYGRYLTASYNIDKGDVILAEKVFSLVPVEGAKICSSCAASNIIPFPCNICTQVFYCSLKCKQAQEMVHRFECYAHRSGLLKAIGITHLAMNTLLNGLPSIVPSLQQCTSPMKIWTKIDTISLSDEKGYPEVLALVTNLKYMTPDEVRSYSLAAGVVATYLMEFTAFFTLFEGTPCSNFEWGVVVSALLLRHTTQMMSNAHSCLAVICHENSYPFTALSDIWRLPRRLKKGQMHKYSRVYINYAGIFPYLSLCNHSCDPSLRSKFDGDRVISVARRDIKKGASIFNSYMMDYRNNLKCVRNQELKAVYHFECKCDHCTDEAGDAEYLKLFKFRCQNSQCEAIFLPPSENLKWFKGTEEATPFLTCPVCRTKLNLDWYWHFDRLSRDPTQILKVLQIMNFCGQILVGLSELRYRMSAVAVTLFFEAWNRGIPLSRAEFKEIGEILNYWLDMIEHKSDVESVLYAAKSAYALDLMAQVDYVSFNRLKIRLALEMLPTELRIIFDNYIDDYIEERF